MKEIESKDRFRETDQCVYAEEVQDVKEEGTEYGSTDFVRAVNGENEEKGEEKNDRDDTCALRDDLVLVVAADDGVTIDRAADHCSDDGSSGVLEEVTEGETQHCVEEKEVCDESEVVTTVHS